MLQNVIPRNHPGFVGDVVVYNGFNYLKSKNGKWGLVLTKSLRAKVLRAYVKSTLREVSKTFGLSMSTVQRIVNEGGLSKGKAALIKSNKDILLANKKLIVKKYKMGFSLREIADIIGIYEYVKLKSVLKEAGVALRTPKERAPLFIAKAQKSGKSQCLRTHNASLQTAYKLSFSSYEEYARYIRKLTSSILNKWGSKIDPKQKRSASFHVDHQLSLFDGWHLYSEVKNKYVKRTPPIPLYMMCHPENLKIMSGATNMKKHSTSHLSQEQLYKKIQTFEKKYGNAFASKVY